MQTISRSVRATPGSVEDAWLELLNALDQLGDRAGQAATGGGFLALVPGLR